MGVFFALYFTPYALIVGQLGSTFKMGRAGSVPGLNTRWDPDWLPRRVDLLGSAYSLSGTKTPAILIALGWAMKGDGSLIKEYQS